MKLFLSSSLNCIKETFVQTFGDIEWKSVAFISNPADLEEENNLDLWRVKEDFNIFQSLWADITTIDLREIQWDELLEVLWKFNFIYVSGGNTLYFKELATKSGFDKIVNDLIIKKWIPYISTSAWSCVMWSKIIELDSTGTLQTIEWYWLINGCICPHWWSVDFDVEHKKIISEAWTKNQNVITLTDKQVIIVNDDGYKIEDSLKTNLLKQ